jgi:DNA primase
VRGARGARSQTADAEAQRRFAAAKDRINLSSLVTAYTALRRRGRELVGLCPFHAEKTPSFEVNDAKGVFYCHGCGAAGDHYTILTRLGRMAFREAFEALSGDTFPIVDPADRVRALEEDRAARAAAIKDVQLMWSRCVAPQGTPAERYLRDVRGITMALPPAVRFGVVPTSRDEAGNWKRPYPAAVFACTDETEQLVGLQRVFLRDDGSAKRWTRSKLSLGRPRGAAVKLAPAASEIVICEGPEDGLTIAQELPGRAVWVALGTAMLPEMRFPSTVSTIVIAGQNDAPGRAAAEKAEEGLLQRGFAVTTAWPKPEYKDWNDQLRGILQ